MRENVTILNQGAALKRPKFPVNSPPFRIPEPCLAAILGCRMLHRIVRVLWETFFERPPAQEGQHSTIFRNSKNLASSSQKMRPDTAETARRRESGTKRDSLHTSVSSPHFQSGSGMLNHTGGTYSHIGMMDHPRIPCPELNLGNFPTLWNFKAGK